MVLKAAKQKGCSLALYIRSESISRNSGFRRKSRHSAQPCISFLKELYFPNRTIMSRAPSTSPPASSPNALFASSESCERTPTSSTHKSSEEGSERLYSTNPSASELIAMDLTTRVVSAYRIRNLATGGDLDLRDEAKSNFPTQFAALVDASDQILSYRRHLYLLHSTQRQQTLVQLWKACLSGDSYKVKQLIEQGVNLMARGLFNWTALHYAADAEFDEVCRVILESGQSVDVDARTEDGQTALHLAAKKDSLPVVIILAGFHADLMALDKYDRLPYSYIPNAQTSLVAGYLSWKNPSLVHICKAKEAEDPQSFSPIDAICPRKQEGEKNGETAKADCFSVLRLVGKGAFAHVYVATHKGTGQTVALKCIKKSLLVQHQMLKYAFMERSVLSSLRHPFIGRMHASFQTPSRLVLVLEYYAGGDLRTKLRASGCFSEELTRKYAAEVFLALEFLHRHSIVYRDLKPENIVLNSEGHIRLVDFGLSKTDLGDDDQTSSFCGSIGYLAPEMVLQRPYSKGIDWYMYGCLLYEMLTGQPPFKTFDVSRLLSLIESGDIQFPGSVSPTAKSLIQGLTAKNPHKRLGIGRLGRSKIKSHTFFSGLDWAQVYGQLLPMPIQALTQAYTEEEDEEEALQAFGNLRDTKMFTKVPGWSFADPSKL